MTFRERGAGLDITLRGYDFPSNVISAVKIVKIAVGTMEWLRNFDKYKLVHLIPRNNGENMVRSDAILLTENDASMEGGAFYQYSRIWTGARLHWQLLVSSSDLGGLPWAECDM